MFEYFNLNFPILKIDIEGAPSSITLFNFTDKCIFDNTFQQKKRKKKQHENRNQNTTNKFS